MASRRSRPQAASVRNGWRRQPTSYNDLLRMFGQMRVRKPPAQPTQAIIAEPGDLRHDLNQQERATLSSNVQRFFMIGHGTLTADAGGLTYTVSWVPTKQIQRKVAPPAGP
uniref:Nucleoprotein n=1 Tax=Equine arteritis virus TaxID=11047 RepID=Q66520_EAV|nr:nucleocapsid [Equine arteritis virus]